MLNFYYCFIGYTSTKRFLADDPIKAKIIATAAIPNINANIFGEREIQNSIL
ncbi:MAG TPA: hypothetical protein VJ697_13180 [Nitrososphaeraceae archaeon]|nr:hypothetical protein [Nitrososphaeraceae archaeon]